MRDRGVAKERLVAQRHDQGSRGLQPPRWIRPFARSAFALPSFPSVLSVHSRPSCPFRPFSPFCPCLSVSVRACPLCPFSPFRPFCPFPPAWSMRLGIGGPARGTAPLQPPGPLSVVRCPSIALRCAAPPASLASARRLEIAKRRHQAPPTTDNRQRTSAFPQALLTTDNRQLTTAFPGFSFLLSQPSHRRDRVAVQP